MKDCPVSSMSIVIMAHLAAELNAPNQAGADLICHGGCGLDKTGRAEKCAARGCEAACMV
jgi:hypothetical protein